MYESAIVGCYLRGSSWKSFTSNESVIEISVVPLDLRRGPPMGDVNHSFAQKWSTRPEVENTSVRNPSNNLGLCRQLRRRQL